VYESKQDVTTSASGIPGTDEALVAAAKDGNERAFETLVRRHRPRIFALALRYARVHEDAEDIVQQTFERAFVHLQQFEGKSLPRGLPCRSCRVRRETRVPPARVQWACHLATLFSVARHGCNSTDRTRHVRRRQRERSLALSQVCWTDGGRREVHGCRDTTSFSTSGHRRMKQLSTSRTLCVLRHAPSLLALSPNKFLLPASPDTLFTTFFRTSQLPGASCHLLCSAASPKHTSTPPLPSIQFA